MHRLLLLLVAVLLAAACGPNGGGTTTSPTGQAQPTAYSSLLLQPMNALPSCGPPPESGDVGEVPGLVTPEQAVLVKRSDTEQLIQVQGFVPLTPVQVLVAYEDLPAEVEAQVVHREHEQFESELVYETDTHRAYVKAQVACATGSNFIAIVAEIEDASIVPTPTGGATPSPTP